MTTAARRRGPHERPVVETILRDVVRAHPELRRARRLVQYVFERDLAVLLDLPIARVPDVLARRARRELVRLRLLRLRGEPVA